MEIRAQNKLNNAQGLQFERQILAACRQYAAEGIAIIEKTPEPFRVLKKGQAGIFQGRFSTPAQPDFKGVLKGGQTIVFEAKKTLKDRIQRNVLTDNQIANLEAYNRLGAFCGVCVSIQNDFYFMPWRIWRDMKEIFGRQYLTAADIEPWQVSYDGAVHFLDGVTIESGMKKGVCVSWRW